jgi:hypothetical protein
VFSEPSVVDMTASRPNSDVRQTVRVRFVAAAVGTIETTMAGMVTRRSDLRVFVAAAVVWKAHFRAGATPRSARAPSVRT